RPSGSTLPDEVVAEPVVKEMLRAAGIAVPRGVTDVAEVGSLQAPLVLKAFGPGIVHKSDVGAVRVGVDHAGLGAAAAAMRAGLATHGITPAGFLVEEQAPAAIELL